MLKISKIADYGTKVMLALAEQPDTLHPAVELAQSTKLPLPTVSKILKLLTKAKLLKSQQGSQGGYQLSRTAEQISLAQIVSVLDGDIAMTECGHNKGCCEMEINCNVKDNWSVISTVIQEVLENISLQQMHRPIKADEIPVTFYR